MDSQTVDIFRLVFTFLRIFLFSGLILYFLTLRPKVPKEDKSVLIMIAGFSIMTAASVANTQSSFPDFWAFIEPLFDPAYLLLMAQIGYILGTFVILAGLLLWGNSVAKLNSHILETETIRQKISEQNTLLQETSRDLEIRTIDYLEQREAAIESERSKTNFLRNTSHELRTPLNAIIGLSELLANGSFKDDDERIEFSKMIYSSGQNLLGTINTILEISRINSNDYTPTLKTGEIRGILDECVKLCLPKAHAKSITISIIEQQEDASRAIFDFTALHHILTRLIDNALSFSPVDTEVTIESLRAENDQVKIVITDQGPGIDPKYIDTIFEVFGRAENWKNRGEGGVGLGLALCSKLTEIQDGRLEIKSDGKQGTTCSVFLPVPLSIKK